MSKPKLLDAYTNSSKHISAASADYAEVGEWADGNPDSEDRIGYFVAVDNNSPGKTMVKASKGSDVRGVTVANPGFTTNKLPHMVDSSGNLLPEYDYVAFIGFATIIDNGTCTVNKKCVSADDGTAIPSDNDYGYQVIERIDDTHVSILVEPQGDSIKRLFDAISSSTEIKVSGKTLIIN